MQTFIDLGINPNVTCIENSTWSDPSGFNLGTYVKGAEGFGTATDPTVLGAYNGAGSFAANANARDFAWVQDTSANVNFNGIIGAGPSSGIIWDLGGQANQLAVFVFVDHGPVPGEVLENTVWLSNDPNALDANWTQASLVHVYGDGWSPGANIADGFVAVYQLANQATFRFASVTWGGPGAIVRDGDNEIDAVGGLNVTGGGLQVPEPGSLPLVALALVAVGAARRRKQIAA
ncbi:MAG: PEP-CTERM sorting domain-containing protein [Burkholderiaceae bacterium]